MGDPLGILSTVVGKIVEKIIEKPIQLVGRHVGFVFHYKENLKSLEDEMNELEEQRRDIEIKVGEANERGEVVEDNVSLWLKEVADRREGVRAVMDDKNAKENMKCFKFSCPAFISRYQLSKRAGREMVDLKALAEKRSKFGPVAHPRPAPPELQFPSSEDYESFRSREEVFRGIMAALKDSNMNMIGVYGTGGVGKTTMVEKIGEIVKNDGTFDQVVMAVVSQNANVSEIQKQLASNLELGAATDENERARLLWNKLKHGTKKVLLILDDTWQELDLKKIGIPVRDENKSKVVLTTRNRDVLRKMHVDKDFEIPFLSEEEAWDLLKKKVGDYVDSRDQQLCHVAKVVCKECKGLPVAINAVGAALEGKRVYVWEDALDQLRNSRLKNIEGIDPKVYASLKLSYDWLESDDDRSCFLLCCLFPEDFWIPINDLVRYCVARSLLQQKPDTLEKALNRVRTVVDTLKDRCLLLGGWDNKFYYVKMHDVVRDVAISIAKDEKGFLVQHGVKEWPEKEAYEHCSAISLRSDTIRELPDEFVCPNLHTLRLECSCQEFQLPDNFFDGSKKLMVLDVNRATMLPTSSSIAKLTELRMLRLNDCMFRDMAMLKDLKHKLEILSLGGYGIEMLPPEVGELTCLRLLDLEECDKLRIIPKGVISKLSRLEELYLPKSFDQWESVIVSVDEIMSLARLTTLRRIHINAEQLPKDLGFENLVRFLIEVTDSGIRHCFDDLSLAKGILQLIRIDLENVLEHVLGKPKWSVERGCMYPSSSFRNLTHLSVYHCKLKYLFSPTCARGLVQLQELIVQGCDVVEGVIGMEGEKNEDEDLTNPVIFPQLKRIDLIYLPNLISFYPNKDEAATIEGSNSTREQSLFNDKVAFPALTILCIGGVPEITEIWNNKSFNVLPQLLNLKKLYVSSCQMLEVVIALEKRKEETQEAANSNIILLPELTELGLDELENYKSFCTHKALDGPSFNVQVALPKLEKLRLNSCENLSEINLWPVLDCEQGLQLLQVAKCDEVSTVVLPFFLQRLQKLDKLIVRNCQWGRENFQLEGPNAGEGQNVGPSTEVRMIVLDGVSQLTFLWKKDPHGLVGFQNLQYLVINNCSHVTNLFTASGVAAVQQLKVLHLEDCSMMEEVIASDEGNMEVTDDDREIVLPKLEWLILKDLSNLKTFCSANHNLSLPSLQEVVLNRCPKMQAFSSGSVSMPRIHLTTRHDIDPPIEEIEDLNKYLEQRLLKGEVDEIDSDEYYGGDEDRFEWIK